MPIKSNFSFRWRKHSLWFLALLLLSSTLGTRPIASFSLSAQKKSLGNGLTVILEKDVSSATTVLQILIKGGQRAEPADKKGLAFLTTRLAVEIPDSDKARELLGLASRFSVGVEGDYSSISVECLSANLEKTLKILSGILRDPLFSSLRVDAVKTSMGHLVKVEADDSVNLGHLAGLNAFFARPGYEGSIYGDEASLRAIKGKDVSAFYKRLFVASNMILAASSDLEEDDLLRFVEKFFSNLPQGTPPSLDPASFRSPRGKNCFIERETQQTFVALAFGIPKITPRNFALGLVLESLLGKGPGSRLWPLRWEKKLAYNVNCRVTQNLDGGMLEAYLETDRTKKGTALAALKETLAKVYEDGLTEEELGETKSVVKTEMLRNHEPKLARALALAFFEEQGLGFGYLSTFFSELEALTLEEVKEYIREVLNPENGFEVAVGPKIHETNLPSPVSRLENLAAILLDLFWPSPLSEARSIRPEDRFLHSLPKGWPGFPSGW